MTSYFWPTWADIIAKEIPESYNYGQSGGGNLFIACQVTEANLRHKFTNDDLIIIMWSGVSREDRFVNNNWLTPGNIFTQSYYDDKFVNTFADPVGYLLRDLSIITMCSGMLDNLKLDYFMLNMAPFDQLQSSNRAANIENADSLLEFFKPTVDRILPDLLTVGCNGTWPQHPITSPSPGGQTADYHPSPNMHFNYLNMIFPGCKWRPDTFQFVIDSTNEMRQARTTDQLKWRSPKPKRFGN